MTHFSLLKSPFALICNCSLNFVGVTLERRKKMESFSFYNPTRILFGKGKIEKIGKELNKADINKCLMVAGGGSIRKNGVYDQVCESLRENHIEWIEAWGVQPNPTVEKVRELIALAKESKVDAILAVGGGSVIDSGKATAAGVFLNDIWNAYTEKEKITRALPIFTVLTISGTGSEMNGNSVLTLSAEKKKWSITSSHLYPQASIIDPSVQSSLPFQQTVNGAIDAISHILEYIFMNETAIATRAIDAGLIKTIVKMIDRLQEDAKDYVARANLAWSATLALNGISGVGLQGGDWACHSIEHSLSAIDPKIAHGEVCGEDSVAHALRKCRETLKRWGSPTNLRELGIRDSQLPEIRDLILSYGPVGEIIRFKEEDIEALLMLAY
jgi:alcohol dehydrogenase YqhD (iron-dependent ADH family)